jgi:prepilin-type N-terminal cleavage/methylation domain-containing protein
VVIQNNSRKRFAFTMIELIFAIVIIAIAVLSLPMMTRATQKGIESSLVQEAIFASSAELIGATAGYWDENSMQDVNVSHLSRVIDISNDCNSTTKLRPGHIKQPFHRRCLDDLSTNANASAGGSVYDLDDAAADSNGSSMFDNPNENSSGYKDAYTSDLSISNTGNIKFLESVVKNKDGEIIVKLKMQSANIGEIDYYKRTMP